MTVDRDGPAIGRVLDALARANREPKETGPGQWDCECPAHEGSRQNLRIAETDDGTVLLHCHAGCKAEAIVEAIGLKMADLFTRHSNRRHDGRASASKAKASAKPGKKPRKTYKSPEQAIYGIAKEHGQPTGCWFYPDANHDLLMQVYRFDGPKGKTYRPAYPTPDGWALGDPPGKLPLYRIPDLTTASRVYFQEGEKVVDLARRLGLVSTTTAHGAESPQRSDLSPLAGKEVVIIPDNDKPGEAYAQRLLELLAELEPQPRARVLRLGHAAEGDDLAEWLDARKDRKDEELAAEIERLADTAPVEELPSREVLEAMRQHAELRRRSPGEGCGLPEILCGEDDPEEGLKSWTPQAINALARANVPPTIFQRGKQIVRFSQARGNVEPTIEPLSSDALRGVLDRVASWATVTINGKTHRETIRYGPPRLDIVRDIMAMPAWDPGSIPMLEGYIETPRFLPDGTLLCTPGYHEPSCLIYAPSPDLVGLEIPERPSTQEVDAALELIFGELLVDFPFANEASKANAMAFMLLPFVRLMIKGPTPLHMFEASTEGTGKGKLAAVTAIPALGRQPSVTAQKEDEAEWRKAITSSLVGGSSHIFFDNMYMPRTWDGMLTPIDSGVLALALTEKIWTDRLLGTNQNVRVEIKNVWMGTGNNVGFSRELSRRIVPIRLDANQERPWERDGFRHELPEWALENRPAITRACLLLCQHWIAEGCPRGRERLGSYESYAATMGGILGSLGVEGFLENKAKGEDFDEESPRWTALTRAWHRVRGEMATSTGQIWDAIHGDKELNELFIDVIGEGSEASQKKRLGKALARHVDRVWGGLRIKRLKDDGNTKTALFRLIPTSDVASKGYHEEELSNVPF